jgi:class 3 adenylate cyclase
MSDGPGALEGSGVTCKVCGTENRPEARFCMECGSALSAGCPICGTVNPPVAKFCSTCGTNLQPGAGRQTAGVRETPAEYSGAAPGPGIGALAAGSAGLPRSGPGGTQAPIAERRLVSVLFADLVGFTTYSEGRDAEEVRELLTRYFELASDVIGRYGGTVEKFIGDAVMAVWGAPIAREDDAERAVRAALELVGEIAGLGPGIQARAGVLTGEAAVTIGATNQGLVAGDLVNSASRLQSAAAPGTVLVGEETQRAEAAAILIEPAGELTLKGKQAPFAAWRAVRVVAERGGRNRGDMLEAPFVGRDDELRLLKDLHHATVREGRTRLISVMGPAGIGKTRLSREFQRYLDGLVTPVWWHAGRSPAYGQGITFWALGEMVRSRASLSESDDEATTRERLAAVVGEHAHDDAEARWIRAALLALLGVGGGSSIDSDELFAAWRTFFERLAESAPVVMVFEDAHQADAGLLAFIDHLIEWSRAYPITVITLARPELLERRPDWGAGLRAFTSIHLEPLTAADMKQLLGGLVPGLPAPALARIVERADGVPLYAVETVRMLIALGDLVRDGAMYRPAGDLTNLAVPETLTALIGARLDGLDGIDRALIEDAAVLGQSFTVGGLAAVSGQPADAVEPRLRGLIRRELLVLDGDARSPERGHYAFVQALIREVAYNTLSHKDRKVRHLAAARYFESLGTDELAGGLAGHYLAAQRLASDEAEASALAAQARLALLGASERAASLGSYEQGRMFLEQALDVTTDPAERAELHERAYRLALNVVDPEPLMQHSAAAVEERRKTGDREAIAVATALRAQSLTTAAHNDPAAALAMVEEAWEEFSDLEQTRGGAELMAAFMRAYRGLANNERALHWTDRLLPVAERLNLMELITRGIQGRGISLLVTGRPNEGITLLRGSHQLAAAHDLVEVELSTRVLLTFYEQWGDPAAGLALGREGLELGRQRGSWAYQFQMVGNTAICALRVGEWDWAATLLDEWLEIRGDEGMKKEFRVDRALLHAGRGQDPTADIEAAAGALEGVTDPQFESYVSYARAAASLVAGDLDAAVRHAEHAARMTDYFQPLAIPLAARAAQWAGDAATATRLLAGPELAAFSGPALAADRTRIAAGIAALDGRRSDALTGFLEAFRAYQELGLQFDIAAAAVDLAVLLPGIAADSVAAAEHISAGRDTLSRLGAAPYLARLERAVSETTVAGSS